MKQLNIFISIIFCILFISLTVNSQSLVNNPPDKQNDSDSITFSIPFNYLSDLIKVDASQIIEISDYKQLLDLFEEHNYTPEVWQKGIREIPRIYITEIGEKWGSVSTKEMTVLYKKRIFFRGVAPIVLHANELIMMDRNRLTKLITKLSDANSISEVEKIWIKKLSKLYKVEMADDLVTVSLLEELQKRVDIIPASLALSQAAAESGWGTSNFAAEGNAMYGQWSWGKDAMIPKEQREHLGNYGVAAFESIQESVSAYMLNLNTHNAYSELRNKRAELRKNGEKITGTILAEQLLRYSERGQSYVNTLKSIIDFNHLKPVDDAYLTDDVPIFLISPED
ncbi:MAG: glucosaminidase [Draconibacterium sp.]|nr:glucosaminidase [Draconibacterium sp.]